MKHSIRNAEGFIKVEIRGEYPEHFVSRCVDEDFKLWHIERKNETTFTCYMKLTDPERIKHLLKATKCRVHVLERNGLPFLLKKMKTRLGIFGGIFLFVMLLFILSNMVWSIDVTGADSKLEEQIRIILKDRHLYEGALDFFVPETGDLEKSLSTKLTRVTWIGVSKDGTTYKVNVVQKKYPKPRPVTGPRNLVATKQAVVQRLFVETGQPVVESDQFVKPGQILVSGIIGNEKSSSFVSAKGKVIGETWYQSKVDIPLRTRYTIYSGKTYRKHQLRLWNVTLGLWGVKKKPYKYYDTETIRKPIHFLIWKLPFTYVQAQYRQKKTVTRTLSNHEALEEALESSNKKLLHSLSSDAKIITSTVDYKKVTKGYLHVHSHQVVYEDIAKPQAINVAKEKQKLKKKKKSE